jgi:hypothetical protein
VLGYLLAADRTRIRGRDQASNWWVVDQMDGIGTCWVANNLTEEEGNLSLVSIMPAPPTPTPEDSSPPTIQINYSPTGTRKPDENDAVTFTARASDDRGLDRIEIYIQSTTQKTLELVKTCRATAECVYVGGPYRPGTLYYQAQAFDQAGKRAETSVSSIRIVSIPK